jgi:hypothetical protein
VQPVHEQGVRDAEEDLVVGGVRSHALLGTTEPGHGASG